jgi:hypothetical protein
MTVQSPYLVKKKIIEKGKLEGVILMNQDKLYKLNVQDLLGLIVYFKRSVLVDYAGADKPATLAVVHEKVADGLKFYFRTVHDKVTKNNFSKVKKVKAISAKKYPTLNINVK